MTAMQVLRQLARSLSVLLLSCPSLTAFIAGSNSCASPPGAAAKAADCSSRTNPPRAAVCRWPTLGGDSLARSRRKDLSDPPRLLNRRHVRLFQSMPESSSAEEQPKDPIDPPAGDGEPEYEYTEGIDWPRVGVGLGAQSVMIGAAGVAAFVLGIDVFPKLVPTPQLALLGVVGMLPLFATGAAADLLKLGDSVNEQSSELVLMLFGTKRKLAPVVLLSLLLGLAAGVGEELLFRGVFQEALTVRFGLWWAVAANSVFFGLLHFGSFWYAVLAATSGLFLSLLYAYSGSLVPPMIAHTLWDMVAFTYMHYQATEKPEAGAAQTDQPKSSLPPL